MSLKTLASDKTSSYQPSKYRNFWVVGAYLVGTVGQSEKIPPYLIFDERYLFPV